MSYCRHAQLWGLSIALLRPQSRHTTLRQHHTCQSQLLAAVAVRRPPAAPPSALLHLLLWTVVQSRLPAPTPAPLHVPPLLLLEAVLVVVPPRPPPPPPPLTHLHRGLWAISHRRTQATGDTGCTWRAVKGGRTQRRTVRVVIGGGRGGEEWGVRGREEGGGRGAMQ